MTWDDLFILKLFNFCVQSAIRPLFHVVQIGIFFIAISGNGIFDLVESLIAISILAIGVFLNLPRGFHGGDITLSGWWIS